MTITVYGLPAPQGSKRHVGNGVMIESSKNVKPWREAVKWAAAEVLNRSRICTIEGPVILRVTFCLPRPKKYAKKPDAVPATRPDLSKLVRSTEDALTDIGVWEDDARVVRCESEKVYVGSPGAMESPGAIITVEKI